MASVFLRAYQRSHRRQAGLAAADRSNRRLCSKAYLLEKALYELLYELNNRPTWLRIPFAGILGFVAMSRQQRTERRMATTNP